jgi:DNA repair exonuclease SbcCD ATPase subunit
LIKPKKKELKKVAVGSFVIQKEVVEGKKLEDVIGSCSQESDKRSRKDNNTDNGKKDFSEKDLDGHTQRIEVMKKTKSGHSSGIKFFDNGMISDSDCTSEDLEFHAVVPNSTKHAEIEHLKMELDEKDKIIKHRGDLIGTLKYKVGVYELRDQEFKKKYKIVQESNTQLTDQNQKLTENYKSFETKYKLLVSEHNKLKEEYESIIDRQSKNYLNLTHRNEEVYRNYVKTLQGSETRYKHLYGGLRTRLTTILECPITAITIKNPMILPSGVTIDSTALSSIAEKDPFNREMKASDLIPNRIVTEILEVLKGLKNLPIPQQRTQDIQTDEVKEEEDSREVKKYKEKINSLEKEIIQLEITKDEAVEKMRGMEEEIMIFEGTKSYLMVEMNKQKKEVEKLKSKDTEVKKGVEVAVGTEDFNQVVKQTVRDMKVGELFDFISNSH